jgi:hypothetical protein
MVCCSCRRRPSRAPVPTRIARISRFGCERTCSTLMRRPAPRKSQDRTLNRDIPIGRPTARERRDCARGPRSARARTHIVGAARSEQGSDGVQCGRGARVRTQRRSDAARRVTLATATSPRASGRSAADAGARGAYVRRRKQCPACRSQLRMKAGTILRSIRRGRVRSRGVAREPQLAVQQRKPLLPPCRRGQRQMARVERCVPSGQRLADCDT